MCPWEEEQFEIIKKACKEFENFICDKGVENGEYIMDKLYELYDLAEETLQDAEEKEYREHRREYNARLKKGDLDIDDPAV